MDDDDKYYNLNLVFGILSITQHARYTYQRNKNTLKRKDLIM